MESFSALPRRFREARLDLELLEEPIGSGRRARRGHTEIVQLDIARRPERFQLYPGADDNRVNVLGVDQGHRQLVLFVQEARRPFELSIPKNAAVPKGARVVREEKVTKVIEQYTDPEKRHFLLGMDEQHLFIAQLPFGVSSVHGARDALRAPEVPPSLHVRDGRVVRQGEWFFMPCAKRDRGAIEAEVRAGRVQRNIGIAQAARLSRAGRPHVADEVVVIREGGNGAVKIFVRGEIRHPDHRTVKFPDFHRTIPNRERFERPEGVFWID